MYGMRNLFRQCIPTLETYNIVKAKDLNNWSDL